MDRIGGQIRSRAVAGCRLMGPGVRMPVYLLVFVTTRCDARCAHCFYWRSLNTERDELTLAEYEALARSAGPVFQVTLTGGSPELRKDLPAIARVFHEVCRPANLTLCMLGRHTDRVEAQVREILESCPGQSLTVGLSLDGIGDEHDRLRGLPGLFDDVVHTFARLGELKKRHPRLSLAAAITVSGLNYHTAQATADWAWAHLPIDVLKPILIRGDPKDPRALDRACVPVYLELAQRERPRLAFAASPSRRRSVLSLLVRAKEVAQRDLICQIARTGCLPVMCSGARETAVIYPSGDVAGCELRPDVLGNLRATGMDLRRIWFGELAEQFRGSTGKVAQCRGCYHHCFISPPLFRSPSLWPRMAKAMWDVCRGRRVTASNGEANGGANGVTATALPATPTPPIGAAGTGAEASTREGEVVRRVNLMGLAIDPVTEEEAIQRVLAGVRCGRGGCVVTPNLDHLRQFHQNPELREIFARADLVVADGTTLVWASRLQGTPLPQRVPGSNLVWSLSGAAAEAGASLFLLGGNPPGTAELAGEALRRRFPGIRIAGTYCPPLGFEHDATELELIRRAIAEASPDIVYVCLGFPKQERLMELLHRDQPRRWFLGLGVSLSFVAGQFQRAPRWVQAIGLEWLHRTLQEPRRLFRRFVLQGIPFAAVLFGSALQQRRRRRRNGGVS